MSDLMSVPNLIEPLDAERILRAAEFATGTWGLADEGLRKRLAAIVECANSSGRLTNANSAQAHAQLQVLMHRRLRLSLDVQRAPAILEERIERPIFVVGYPRTGTSMLHSLLAQDVGSRSPAWWQTHEPSPPPGEVPPTDYRLSQAGRALDEWVDAIPGILTMHPYWDDREHTLIEDEELFSLDLQGTYPTMLYRVPGLDGMATTTDAGGAYRFQRLFLQHQQYKLPARRWALKGVMHQFQLDALLAEFPDALLLWPHRDPAETYGSTLAVTAVVYGAMSAGRIDWPRFASAMIEGLRIGIDHVLSNPLLDDPRIIHLRFKELTADPVAAIRKAYATWDLPYTEAFEAAMREWLASNQGDRYGRYPYALAPFGLDAANIRSRFADYRERFGV